MDRIRKDGESMPELAQGVNIELPSELREAIEKIFMESLNDREV